MEFTQLTPSKHVNKYIDEYGNVTGMNAFPDFKRPILLKKQNNGYLK